MTLEPSFLDACDAHIWTWGLEPSRPTDASRFLTAEELSRAERFATRALSERWIMARAGARRVLGFYLGAAPEAVRLELSEHGKPFTPHAGLSFNWSHTAQMAALVVTPSATAGVDIEEITAIEPELPEACLTATELTALQHCDPAQRDRTFFSYWVFKEAYVKAVGVGLSREFGAIEFHIAPGAAPALTRALDDDADPGAWRFHEFTIGKMHIGAAALRGREARFVQMAHLSSPDALISLPDAALMSFTKGAQKTIQRAA